MSTHQAQKHTEFKDWTPAEAVSAGDAVEGLTLHPGYPHLIRAIEAIETVARKQLMSLSPTNNGAEYADRVGELKGIRKCREVADHIIEHAKFVEETDKRS